MTPEQFTISSNDAVRLTRQAQECLLHDIFFAQALMVSPPEEIETLRAILKRANTLRATKMDDFQKEVHRGVKLTDRAMRRAEKAPVNLTNQFRRTFRVGAIPKKPEGENSPPEKAETDT